MEGGSFFYLDSGRIKTLATSWKHGDVLPVCGAAQRITLEIEDALGTGTDAYDALFSLSRALSAQLFRICREEVPERRRKGRVEEACEILGGRSLF